jgi:hypothetical protein
MPPKAPRIDAGTAETIAIQAVGFLAARPPMMARFAGLTGVDVGQLRASLGDPAFLGAVLDFVLGDEALLLEFAGECGLPPEAPARARRLLPGATEETG